MIQFRSWVVALSLFGLASSATAERAAGVDYLITPVPATTVQLNDGFWTPRMEVNRTVTLPAALKWCATTGRISNFDRAAAALRGEAADNKMLPAKPFEDAEVFKVIEAASYSLSAHQDAELGAKLDELIAKIAAAQEKDGYLYTARTIDPEHPHPLTGTERWINEKADSYELSNLGYLFEAAIAHFQATGKRSLLDVAIKSADLLDNTFGPGKKSIWPGHETVEEGLIDLYRATGEKRYLTLANFFIDQRGPDAGAATGRSGRLRTNQSQQKAIDQTDATGNAMDGANLYCSMTDIAALNPDSAYKNAVDKIWANVVGQKLYVTGGIGAAGNEGTFARNYQLPNMNAASATSASLGNVRWNQRMFQLHGDGKYIDVLERALYNTLLASVALDGQRFFDTNVLESVGRPQRRDWPTTNGDAIQSRPGSTSLLNNTSTPIEIARFIAALPSYAYATGGNAVYVNLYIAGKAEIQLTGGPAVKIDQETKYPWDGAVKLTLTPNQSARFTLNLRVPAWARNEVVPSDLYSFMDKNDEPVVVKVNGNAVASTVNRGYVNIDRQWAAGDIIELVLPMPVRRVRANERVTDDRERVMLQRGPIVYCLETAGAESTKVRNLVLANDAPLQTNFERELLGGVCTVTGKVLALSLDEHDNPNHREQTFIAIPYYAWSNRGPSEMVVWIANTDATAVPIATPNLAASARITCSAKQPTQTTARAQPVDGRAAKDGIEPRSSHDNGPLSHFDWWPDRNVTEWCEYSWDQPVNISQTQLYWWDDSTVGGGCKTPVSWKAFYKSGDSWKPVETSDEFGVAKDQYNKVNFKPVTTTGLRLEIVVPTDASVGIQEWKVR